MLGKGPNYIAKRNPVVIGDRCGDRLEINLSPSLSPITFAGSCHYPLRFMDADNLLNSLIVNIHFINNKLSVL